MYKRLYACGLLVNQKLTSSIGIHFNGGPIHHVLQSQNQLVASSWLTIQQGVASPPFLDFSLFGSTGAFITN